MSGASGLRFEVAGSSLRWFKHHAMACTWGLAIAHPQREYARQVAYTVYDEIDRLERELSRFVPEGDVARINALPAGGRTRIGPDAFECLKIAQRMHAVTRGAFDVTIGSLLRTGAESTVSGGGERPPWGMHKLEIDDAAKTVGVAAAGVVIDLGGIGKGYAIDRGVELLRDWNIDSALLHSGQSTAYVLGRPPGADAWRLEVRDPIHHDRAFTTVRLCDAAISGSGALLHGPHILDPRTGSPVRGAIGAWSIAPTAAEADALSTAFMVLAPEDVGDCCCAAPGVSALLIREAPCAPVVYTFSRGFELERPEDDLEARG
ncbi:MAG: FAD:protein FMN transferase [Phycisphaerae bacterium]|jgi:thiamine biosynthesis lipoprotein